MLNEEMAFSGTLGKEALARFLKFVRDIPEVKEVRLSDSGVVCTVISADTTDSGPRYRVFEAQACMIREIENQPYDFRLVNRESLTIEKKDKHIEGYGKVVWSR